MVSTHLQPPFASYEKAEGVKSYSSKCLEGNWFEERTRIENGEENVDAASVWPAGVMLKGSVIREQEPDVTPDESTCDSTMLTQLDRMRRSRISLDSNRQGADDGYREYKTMNQSFYMPIAERPDPPLSFEPGYHGTWGGPIQKDGRTKSRNSADNRQKNTQVEPDVLADGDKKAAKKMISAATLHHATVARPSAFSDRTSEFGSVVPPVAPSYPDAERLQTTTRLLSEWMGDKAATYRAA